MLLEKTVLVDEGVAMDLARLIQFPGACTETPASSQKMLSRPIQARRLPRFCWKREKALADALVPIEGGFELKKTKSSK